MENKTSAERVRHALQQSGLDGQVVELPESTRTAVDAARAVHCEVKQIAKSLIFKTRESGQAILVITSGANRVNEEVVGSIVGEEIAVASPDFVREQTGFAIGGVSPVGLIQEIPIFIDQDLLQVEKIWAAAGTPRSVFKVLPAQLLEITEGKVISVR